MRSSWFEPYLWIHVAGILAFPLWMGLCLLGLATGNPTLPIWLEVLVIAVLGAGPVLAMQLLRPFNIFSALVLAVPTECLDDSRRSILSTFQDRDHQLLAGAIAALLCFFLIDSYHLAPLAEELSPIRATAPGAGISRLALAIVGFLGANLFLQVPLCALRIMVMPEEMLSNNQPVSLEDASEQFTTIGWQWAGLIESTVENDDNSPSETDDASSVDDNTNSDDESD